MDSSAQRTLIAASSLGDHNYLLNLASLVLYLDIVLSLFYKLPLSAMSAEWVKVNITLGDAVTFLLGYVFLRAFLLPTVVGIYAIAIGLPLALWLSRKLDKYVPERLWLEYAILAKNTPAHRELENKRKEDDVSKEGMRASFSLTVMVVFDVCLGSGQTLAAHAVELLRHTSMAVAWLSCLVMGLFLLALLLRWLLAPFAFFCGIEAKTETLRAEIQSVLLKGSKE